MCNLNKRQKLTLIWCEWLSENFPEYKASDLPAALNFYQDLIPEAVIEGGFEELRIARIDGFNSDPRHSDSDLLMPWDCEWDFEFELRQMNLWDI